MISPCKSIYDLKVVSSKLLGDGVGGGGGLAGWTPQCGAISLLAKPQYWEEYRTN